MPLLITGCVTERCITAKFVHCPAIRSPCSRRNYTAGPGVSNVSEAVPPVAEVASTVEAGTIVPNLYFGSLSYVFLVTL